MPVTKDSPRFRDLHPAGQTVLIVLGVFIAVILLGLLAIVAGWLVHGIRAAWS